MAMNNVDKIDLDEGWAIIYPFIQKTRGLLENGDRPPFDFANEYMMCLVAIYKMCTRPNVNYSEQLYIRYRSSFEEYVTSRVLPDLIQKQPQFLSSELLRHWEIYKEMLRLLSNIFGYLERYFIPSQSLPTLRDVGLGCFKNLVLSDEVNSLFDREEIDRTSLLENLEGFFLELGILYKSQEELLSDSSKD